MNNLPDDCIMLIINHVSYHEVGQLRTVSRRLNRLCSDALNAGFRNFRQMHETCLKQLKDTLPKRESERTKHHLNLRHTMLLAIETRVSLLMMTYHRYILDGAICFIPGKVLDELFRLLRIIQDRNRPISFDAPGKFGFLQELRDLSSMAIEHFDDHIAPDISSCEASAKLLCGKGVAKRSPGLFGYGVSDDRNRLTDCEGEVDILKKKVNVQECCLSSMKAKLKTLQSTVIEQNGQIAEISKQLVAMQKFLNFPQIDAGSSNMKKLDMETTSSGKKRRRRSGGMIFSKKAKLEDADVPCNASFET